MIYAIADDPASEGTLRKLYSHFRPTRKDPGPSIIRSHPAGDIPGSRTTEAAELRKQIREAEVVKQTVSLEAHELFSQLCISAGLVQIGPRRGVFISNVDAVEKKTFRIWRHWLAGMAKRAEDGTKNALDTFKRKHSEDLIENNNDEEQMVWVDQNKIAGLKVRVRERKWRRDTPILVFKDEDEAVSYSLEFEGQCSACHAWLANSQCHDLSYLLSAELVISTTHLMLAVERSLLDIGFDSGRAMIFGSFATTQNGQQVAEAAAS